MIKKIDSQALLEFICFSFFSVLIFYLTVSGGYLSYVTPKMAPYLYFTSAVMLVWAVSKLSDIFRPQHKIRAAHCLVLIIPILFLLLPHSAVIATGTSSGYFGSNSLTAVSNSTSSAEIKTNNTMASQSNSTLEDSSTVTASASNENTAGNSASDDTSSSSVQAAGGSVSEDSASSSAQAAGGSASAGATGQDDNSIVNQYGLKLSKDGSIDVSDDLFYPWLTEIFTNMKKYEGVKITIKGFVFKDSETMDSNEFVPARLLMWCCSADLSPCGIICEYDKSSELEENSWVKVTGVIHIGKYQGADEPQITVTSVSLAEKPQQEYVYPW